MGVDAALVLGFETLDREVSDQRLPVEGTVPDWLDGALIRNGAAKFEVGGDRVDHWFDGLAMLHRFGFQDGEITYTNRFLRTGAYRQAVEEGDLPAGFATGGSYLRRLRDLVFGESTDNANVHVARFGGEFVALTEVPRYVAFDPETLQTRGEFRFADDLSGAVNCAHVVPDPHRGETVGLLTAYGRRNAYRLYRIVEGSRTRELIREIPVEQPAYVHSFALSANYVILTEHPFVVDPRSFLLPGGESFADHFDYIPARGTRFHVIDRDSGKVVAHERTDPFFVFHHANAFERPAGGCGQGDASAGAPNEIVVDLVSYSDESVLSGLYLDDMAEQFRSGTDGRLRRWRIPLDGGSVESTLLYDGIEFPRVARGERTRQHHHVYGQGAADPDGNHLVRVDAETGDAKRWEQAGVFVEEPVVVRPPGDAVDSTAGVVLATALNTREERTDLLVLDATTLELRARAPLPHAVPFGFHGRYFSAEEVSPADGSSNRASDPK